MAAGTSTPEDFELTSRERLLTAIRGGKPDRVPVTIYEVSPFGDEWYHREPSYESLVRLQREYGDSFLWVPIGAPVFQGDPNAMHGRDERRADGSVVRTTTIETPKGEVRGVSRRDAGLMTHWRVEPLVKSDEDIERLLSISDPPVRVSADAIRGAERRAGDRGVLVFSIGDAIGHVVGLFDFEDFVLRCYEDDSLVRELIAKAQRQLCKCAVAIGRVVSDACVRLWGPEYCGAPLMNPDRFFHDYVVEPDKQLTDLIHETGNLSVIHCHGRLAQLLEPILEIGPDGLEPLETLPVTTADVTMAEIKQRIGSRMCLMGGMQAVTLECGSVEQVTQQAEGAVRDGAPGGGFVLLPTSMPVHVPLDEKTVRNYEAMFRVAHAHRY